MKQLKDVYGVAAPSHLKKCLQLALLGVKCPPSCISTRALSHLSTSVWLRSSVTSVSLRPTTWRVGKDAGRGK